VRSRVSPYVAGLITLAMVVFGQVCALHQFVEPGGPAASDVAFQAMPAADEHTGTCTSDDCGGEVDTSCPTGAAECCSTWGPPSSRLLLPPPSALLLTLADAWLVVADRHVVEERVLEVALFELARPPGFSADALLSSSLSRRGPPALS
jgi:hypothetical protein